ncbi:MAG: signal peptidase I [Oscillospiraceae bacterium]|nr:signal peptidase I [Oscillospiraceae bacterium]
MDEQQTISRKERRLQQTGKMPPQAGDKPAKKKKPWCRELLEWVAVVVVAVVLASLINEYVFQIIPVLGSSMEPTLYTGDRMVVTKFTYKTRVPERGEIVITKYPGSTDYFVKRVIGLPGEKIGIHDGAVYINDVRLEEDYIMEEIKYTYNDVIVPEGCIFVMGDNRNYSSDSHVSTVGPLPLANLVGKPQLIIYPFDKIGSMAEAGYDGK